MSLFSPKNFSGFFLALLILQFHDSQANSQLTHVPSDIERYIGDQPVRSFAIDSHGNSWVGTQSGLIRLVESTDSTSRLTEVRDSVLGFTEIVDLAQNEEGELIARAYSGDLYKLDAGQNRFMPLEMMTVDGSLRLDKQERLQPYTDARFSGSSSSTAWMFTATLAGNPRVSAPSMTKGGGVCDLQSKVLVCGLELGNQYSTRVFELPISRDIASYFYLHQMDAFLAVLDNAEVIQVPINKPGNFRALDLDLPPGTEVRAFLELSDQSVLLGTDNGLFWTDDVRSEWSALEVGRHSRITGLTEIGDDIWVLSESGLGLLIRSKFPAWPSGQRTPIEVLSFARAPSGHTLIGTYEGLFSKKADQEPVLKAWPLMKTSTDSRITALAIVDGTVFAGTFKGGLHVLEQALPSSSLELKTTLLAGNGITAIQSIRDLVVVGTEKNGLKLVDRTESSDIEMPVSWLRKPSPVTSISELPNDSRILVTTENEVFLLCVEDSVFVCQADILSHFESGPRLLSALATKDGTVWLGSLFLGLYRSSISELSLGKRPSLAFHSELKGLSVYNILDASNGLIWLGTNRGLLLLDTLTGSIRRFDRSDGLLNTDFNHGADIAMEFGAALIGGSTGFNYLPNTDDISSTRNPHIWLREVGIGIGTDIGLQSLPPDIDLRLDQARPHFWAEVSLNDLRFVDRNRYEFLLEGFDSSWKLQRKNGVAYTNLPPGNYIFRARGIDSAGNRSVNEIAIPVHVAGPLWQTWWAYLIYATLFIIAGSAAKKLYDRHLVARTKLQFADEQAAALTQIEDDYQEQVDVNERILRQRASDAQQLIGVVSSALDACEDPGGESNTYSQKLSAATKAIAVVERVATRTSFDESCNTREIADELAAQWVRDNIGSEAIILNDIEPNRIPIAHGRYVAIILEEVMRAALTQREYPSSVDPVVTLSSPQPVDQDDGALRYRLVVADNATLSEGSGSAMDSLVLTTYLTESLGGSVNQTVDRGNVITVSLILAYVS